MWGKGKEGTAISWLHTGEQNLEEEGEVVEVEDTIASCI
jgi:hypothetical protein